MAEEPQPSRIDVYLTRDAFVYYLLVLPAVVGAIVFSLAIATTPGALVTQAGGLGGLAVDLAQILPFAILAASAYAVFSFRPSLLVTLLIATFFVAVSVTNGISLLGAQLDLEATVGVVVAAAVLALAGFNYARGLKLLAGRVPKVESSGPVVYNVLGIAMESALPLGAALALVVIVGAVVSGLGAQAAHLPEPLSALATLYLQTRIGLVMTTLFVAGAAIWVMRQFLEPIILHFTLSSAAAKRELLSEIEPTTKSVKKLLRYRPTRGLAWGVLGVGYPAGILIALLLFTPTAEVLRDLGSILTLHAPSETPLEALLQSAFENGIVKADILFAQSQDYLRDLVRLLWG